MERIKRLLAAPATTVVMFILAVVLLVTGTIGGARAALTRESEYFSGGVALDDIGVTLLENGKEVSYRNYIQNSSGQWSEASGRLLEDLTEDGKIKPGIAYPEELAVQNSGTIDEYVRVTVYKYWMDGNEAQSQKEKTLAPDKIDLNFLTDNGWWLDETSSTPERTVLYYTRILPAGGITPPLTDTLTIDGSIVDLAEQETMQDGAYTRITTTYMYNGKRFRVEAEVNAVQTHNAEDAILSAWGRHATVSDSGSLTIN